MRLGPIGGAFWWDAACGALGLLAIQSGRPGAAGS